MNLDNFKIQIRKITDFSEDECSMFIPYLNRKTLKKGEYLLKEGQKVNEIAFVETGLLRFYYLSDGKEINNHFFLENDYAVSYLDFLKKLATQGTLKGDIKDNIPRRFLSSIMKFNS